MVELLALVGGATLFTIAISVILFAGLEFAEFIRRKEEEYKIKHRFDKPPTAKCYCVDCVNWNEKNSLCSRFGDRYTADCWFCWEAHPRKKVE